MKILARLLSALGAAIVLPVLAHQSGALLDATKTQTISGKVVEFNNEEIEELQRAIARKLGYRLVDHRLELYAVPVDAEDSGGKKAPGR